MNIEILDNVININKQRLSKYSKLIQTNNKSIFCRTKYIQLTDI